MDIIIGQTEKHEFTITDSEGAVDLTGSTVRFTITDSLGELVYQQEKTTFDAPESGIVVITIPRTETALFQPCNIKSQIDVRNTLDEKDYSEIYFGVIKSVLSL